MYGDGKDYQKEIRSVLRNLTSMTKSFTLIQTIATAAAFSAVSCWYGFMFGRESARKQLGNLIEDLRRGNQDSGSDTTASPHT